MIVKAGHHQIDAIIALVATWCIETFGRPPADTVGERIAYLIDEGTVLVSAPDDIVQGVVIGYRGPHPMTGQVVLSELVLFAQDGSGFALMRAFVGLARAGEIVTASTQAQLPRAGIIMKRLGFREIETGWVLEV